MMTDDYKEIGPSRRIIREGFNFETRKTIYCLDKDIFHYQFTSDYSPRLKSGAS